MAYKKVKDGIFIDPKTNRLVEHRGYATRIFWNTTMLDYVKQHYARTLNEELAGCLGVSVRTLIRKARDLGLKKDEGWLCKVRDERRMLAYAVSRRKGFPNRFKKGGHANPDGEFKKGHRLFGEVEAKRKEKIRRWCLLNPTAVLERGRKAAETRRRNKNKTNN